VDEFWLARFPVSPLMYRYLVFLALPIGFVAILLVRFLKWTRVLGGLGEALDGALHTVLVGYLDDVADYAMDPAQSHRVRSAVKDDILYFHRRPEVKRIHVIAHSQGTPITYETLFRFLEIENQKKIYTYLTIGGVLSYYNQAREIFDAIYYNRFPVDVEKEQGFHPDFRWMNFWNFTDPITEFYGLDEYTWFEEAPPLDKTHRRTRTTPRNIRTRSSLLKNHGEYWSNIEQINLPFAKRVLGETRPKEWDPESINPKNWHHAGVLLLWLILLASLSLTFYYLFDSGLLAFVTDYFAAINIDVQDTIKHFENLFLPKEGREASLIEKVASLVGSNSILELWQKILGGLVAGLAGVAVIDWVSQITRAFGSTQGE
jgi:hypothetical protein